ncbi:MAG TPA: adenylate/guanylate cyclase domain-containing protein [Gemmatimonadaceae bacterium]|nr:adenylate/guanylate cyclase domain-containing protein [Gemmatimonadaceae bacterium]
MQFKLISTESEQSYELRSGAPLVVGRALNCDIPILDPTISRRHAEVVSDTHGIEIRDLGSSNGTFLNGIRVETTRATAGDVVTFGSVAFRLKEVAPSGEGPTVAEDSISRIRPGATILREVRVRDTDKPFVGRRKTRTPVAEREVTPVIESRNRSELKLELLLAVSRELSRAVDVDTLLEKIVRTTFKILDADRVSILLADDHGELVAKIASDKDGEDAERTVPQSIARRVVEEKVAVLSDNAPEDQRFGGDSILMQRVRSAMCAPLIGSENRVLGVIYVDNLTLTHRFGDADLEFLVAFAGIAAVAIENSQFSERIRRETLIRSNFERYFAPSLAARIASSPDAVRLGGEKRTVAVLFSDIRNFTPLSEVMNPDDTARLLTEYFTEMVECVFRHGGTLDKFIGDAVMAQWGAPISAPDDADRAMDAALDMMRALETLNATWRADGRPELTIGIGLNFGDAFAGNIGSERRLEYTVIGDTVNTASRLCSAADGGEILVSEDFRAALKRPPGLVAHAPMELKGKTHAVPLYSVVL